MTTDTGRPDENSKTEQKKENESTEKLSAVDLMDQMLKERGSTEIKIKPPKGYVQVIFKR